MSKAIKPHEGIVLSLFDRTTHMVRPWAEAGWLCYCVDMQHPPGEHREGNIIRVGADILNWLPPRSRTKITFAFPPCTHLAVSGARWFRDKSRGKGLGALTQGLTLFARAIEFAEWIGAPYMVENPISVVSSHLRQPEHTFDPSEYAGYLPKAEQGEEAFTKRTCLWTGCGFVMPKPKSVPPTLGSKMHKLPPSEDRANLRSATPRGFARAVYLANVSTNAFEGAP